MATTLSQNVKNGQQLRVAAAPAPIAAGDVVEIGGPGNQAWSVATADYAAQADASTLQNQMTLLNTALSGKSRQPVARDRLGNIYIAQSESSGNLVAFKMTALNGEDTLQSSVLDGTTAGVHTLQLHQLSNGNFVCVYARAAGALFFVIFDSMLGVVSGPTSVATERAASNVVYHTSCALSGGGFAIVYQSSAATQVLLATYSNAGAVVTAAANIQTLASAAAQVFLKVAQLSSGNLVCAIRGTMTAGGTAGTNFVIVSPTATAVAGPTNLDSTAVLGFVELSKLTGFFAIAEANGTNLIAAVYSDAGARQGSVYSVGDTFNSTTFPQVKLTNDGVRFVLAWFSSAGDGVYVITFATTGVAGSAASGIASSAVAGATSALDAEVINGQLVVLAASTTTDGQVWFVVGLPDANIGVTVPYLRNDTTATIGSSAATTGSNWPRVLSGGGGLYQAASPPANQPVVPSTNGDFTAIFVYDHQNSASTYVAIQKFEASAVMGVALQAKAQDSASVLVNPGQGEYVTNAVGGTPGTAFNNLVTTPAGTAGVFYNGGIGLTGIARDASTIGGGSSLNYQIGDYRYLSIPVTDPPDDHWLFPIGQAVSRTEYAAYFAKVGTLYGVGDGSTTFNLPYVSGCVFAAADDLGGSSRGILGSGAAGGFTGAASIGAQDGEQSHQLTVAELANHQHPSSDNSNGNQPVSPTGISPGGFQTGNTTAMYLVPNTGFVGGDDPHNNVQPTIICNVLLRVK